MANDLNKLNDVLFDTLDKVRSGEMDNKQAQTVVNVGNTILNNAKIQLNAFKLTKGKTSMSLVGKNDDPMLEIGEADGVSRYEMAQKLARFKEYKNVPDAIADMGKHEFNKAVDKYMLDGKVD